LGAARAEKDKGNVLRRRCCCGCLNEHMRSAK
jgi:hypothetical protein